MKGRLIAIPIEELTRPRNGDCHTGRWWVTHESGAVFFQMPQGRGWAPQCNGDRRIAERLAANYGEGFHTIIIPVAYLGPWSDDWGHTLGRLADHAVDLPLPADEGP